MTRTGARSISRTQKSDVFGHIPGVPVNTIFDNRQACINAGVHPVLLAGIYGRRDEGAFSVVMSGGYEDDEDQGSTFAYTGCAGRDKGKDGQKRDGDQTEDQTFEHRLNKALLVSSTNGKPVRVIRGSKLESVYAPWSGYRYDGLYRVEKAWKERGKKGFLMCKFSFRRFPDQPRIPRRDDILDTPILRWRTPSADGPSARSRSPPPQRLTATESSARAKNGLQSGAPTNEEPTQGSIPNASSQLATKLLPGNAFQRSRPTDRHCARAEIALPSVPRALPVSTPRAGIANAARPPLPTALAPLPLVSTLQGLRFKKKRPREDEQDAPPVPLVHRRPHPSPLNRPRAVLPLPERPDTKPWLSDPSSVERPRNERLLSDRLLGEPSPRNQPRIERPRDSPLVPPRRPRIIRNRRLLRAVAPAIEPKHHPAHTTVPSKTAADLHSQVKRQVKREPEAFNIARNPSPLPKPKIGSARPAVKQEEPAADLRETPTVHRSLLARIGLPISYVGSTAPRATVMDGHSLLSRIGPPVEPIIKAEDPTPDGVWDSQNSDIFVGLSDGSVLPAGDADVAAPTLSDDSLCGDFASHDDRSSQAMEGLSLDNAMKIDIPLEDGEIYEIDGLDLQWPEDTNAEYTDDEWNSTD